MTNQDLTISVNGGLSAGMVDIQPEHQGQHERGRRRLRRQEPVGERLRPVVLARHLRQRRLLVDQPQRVRRVGRPVRLDVRRPGRQPDAATSVPPRAPRSSGRSPTSTATGSPTACTRRPRACSPSTTSATGSPAHAVKLGGGGFESRESATGGAGLGFSLPYGEFGGGVNLLFNYDWSTYSWRDVNGDGILDQLRRESTDSIKVRFGTGSGLLPEVDYGNLTDGGGQPGHRRRRARRLRPLLGHRRRRLGDRSTSARSASSPATSSSAAAAASTSRAARAASTSRTSTATASPTPCSASTTTS